MKALITTLAVLALALSLASHTTAQRGRGGDWIGEDGKPINVDRRGVPEWEVDREFENDVFTFVTVSYTHLTLPTIYSE